MQEDRDYYDDAEKVYPEATVLVQEGWSLVPSVSRLLAEDTQALSEPIIKRVETKVYDHRMETETFPPSTFSKQYMIDLMGTTPLIRNVVLAGHLHHGKTSFAQLLLEQTHNQLPGGKHGARFTDTRFDEQARGISLKVVSLLSLISFPWDRRLTISPLQSHSFYLILGKSHF